MAPAVGLAAISSDRSHHVRDVTSARRGPFLAGREPVVVGEHSLTGDSFLPSSAGKTAPLLGSPAPERISVPGGITAVCSLQVNLERGLSRCQDTTAGQPGGKGAAG